MPNVNFNVSKSLLEDLRQLSSLGPESLISIADSLDGENACIIKPSDIRKKISEHVDGELSVIVERVVMGLATFRRQRDAKTDEILEVLNPAVQQAGWDESVRANWSAVGPALGRLLDKPSISITAKAVDLLYDYDAFFVDGNILTDIRPVFDERRGSVVGAAVNHTLRLSYSDAAGKQTVLSLVLDAEDIQKVKRACEEAIKKGAIIIDDLQAKWKIMPLTIDEIKNDK